jgi:hypothetical protein
MKGCCKVGFGNPVYPFRPAFNNPEKIYVIAFDVDGTLWLGSPAGRVTREMVDSCRDIAVLGIVSARADAPQIASDLGLDFGYTGGELSGLHSYS